MNIFLIKTELFTTSFTLKNTKYFRVISKSFSIISYKIRKLFLRFLNLLINFTELFFPCRTKIDYRGITITD